MADRYGLFDEAGRLVRETRADEDFGLVYPDRTTELRICPDHPTVSAVDCLDCDRLHADAPKGSASWEGNRV